jgi:predicted AAA+ superfamily ATPase
LLNQFAKVSEGALFENSVFLNLRKYGKINYYQKRSGAEIDFILNKSIALEVKLRGVDLDLKKLEKIAKALKLPEWYIVSKNFVEGNHFIPAQDI